MGYASWDDLLSNLTVGGRFWNENWNKQTMPGTTGVAGRWYDRTPELGYPAQLTYGDLLTNGIFSGNANGWTLGANWFYNQTGTAPNTVAKTAGGSNNLSQTTMTVVAGHYYLLSYTITAHGGTYTLTPSIGGASGTARSAAGTYTEIIGPAVNGTALTFTPSNASLTCTLGVSAAGTPTVSCVDIGTANPGSISAQLSDTMLSGAMYHGGNVSPRTKHLLNAGFLSATATFNPGLWLLCDMLLAYPGITLSSTALQTCITTLTLPRYVDGAGVRAFIIPSPIAGAANAQNIVFTYTNQAGVSGHVCPVTLANTPSAALYQVSHSGVAANNFGPFIPLAAGDTGIQKVDSIQLSAAAASATYATIILCKPLAIIPMTTASVLAERGFGSELPAFPRIVDGACLGLLHLAGGAVVASSNVYGYMDFGWA